MRYLNDYIQKDLRKKCVLFSGPRQVGKTTLSKFLLDQNGSYLNWDINEHKQIILKQAWKKNSQLVVLDEIHKLRGWKNYIKGVIDQYQNKPPMLLTGSARLGLMSKDGDPLTGRTYHYRLHPLDLEEIKNYFPDQYSEKVLDRLLKTGGFPESFFNPKNAARLRKDRLDIVLKDDIFSLTSRAEIRGLELLVELLRERVGGSVNYANIANDLSISPPTVKKWMQLLENLYIIFFVYPYAKNLPRSIRKEPKVYFYDCSSAYQEAARIENLVACSLLKYCHFETDTKGKEKKLHYFRDKDRNEVDFLISDSQDIDACIEVKTSQDQVHRGLKYLSNKINSKIFIQLVKELKNEQEVEKIKVLRLNSTLEKIGTLLKQ